MRDWLLEARRNKGMTQLDLAKKLDISEGYYSFIESGDRQKKMDIALAAKLSVILDLPIETIIGFESNGVE